MRELENFVGGAWVRSSGTTALPVKNPATGEHLAEVPLSTAADVDTAVKAAQAAFPGWSATPPVQRARYLFKLREVFDALDCRDFARIDLRMNAQGQVYVFEVNPLPGLTPDYSDLVLIGKAVGMDYRTLIGEILAGGLKRMREKKRDKAEKVAAERAADREKPNGSNPAQPQIPGLNDR